MRIQLLRMVLLMGLIGVVTTRASEYPKIDASSPWEGMWWDGGALRSLNKRVSTGPGAYSNKTAFYEIALEGIKIDGNYYAVSEYSQIISSTCNTYGTDVVCGASIGFIPLPPSDYSPDNPNFQYKVTFTVSMAADGKFDFQTSFYRPTMTFGQTKDFTAYVKLDYDMENSGDNIFEFTWGNQADNPPAATSPISYTQPGGTAWSNYWGAVANEVKVQYPVTFTDYDAIGSFVPMRRPMFRALRAATSLTQFGAVFWTLHESQTTRANIDIATKAYSYAPSVPWSISTGTNIQTTSNIPPFPRYAHSGSDLMTEVVVHKSDAGNQSYLGLQGKLFQRPNERPLQLYVKYHSGVGNWVNSPSGNIFNQTIRTVSGENRSMRTALNRLVADDNLFMEASTMPMYSGYTDGSSIDPSGLHNMLANCLACKETPTGNLNSWNFEVNAWIVHAWVTNWRLSGSNIAGAMFDGTTPTTRSDGAAREGAAIFWPAILAYQSNQTGPASQMTSLTTLHEIGHTFGFEHKWSSCHEQNGSLCATAGVAPDIMSIYAQTDNPANTVRYNEEDPSVGNSWTDRNLARFFKYGPESWVKPGRNSSWFRDEITGIPAYTPY